MPGLAHHFYTMACNNAWANLRLLAACARLADAEFVAPRVSFFPSLAATLNHNLTGNRRTLSRRVSTSPKCRTPTARRWPPRSAPSTTG